MFEITKNEFIKYQDKLNSELEKEVFKKCFFDCINNCIKYINDDCFVITGDINAMWLRDSSTEVMHYLDFVKDDDVKDLIKRVLKRQFRMIVLDPYANAFNLDDKKWSYWKKRCKSNEFKNIVFERKFELDSLCYPLFLAIKYYDKTNDISVFDSLFIEAFDKIIETIEIELNHERLSKYFYIKNRGNKEIINKASLKEDSSYNLVWQAFRPSDDECFYKYNIPSNMFLVTVLNRLIDIFDKLKDPERLFISKKYQREIRTGIERYGIVEINNKYMYCYETDCKGSYCLDDDANIPSLLSIPYLEYPFLDKDIYKNTRDYILSSANKYYYIGNTISGIGSKHTKENNVWPLSVIMEGITSNNIIDKKRCYKLLVNSTNNTFLMHESINKDDESDYTRSWFTWANSLFSEFVIKNIDLFGEKDD